MKSRRFGIVGGLICLAFLLLWASRQSSACPFCLSPPQTLVEQMSGSDIVLIAELVRFRVYDQGTRPESTLRIREYLHGQQFVSARREMAVGQPIVIEAEAAGKPGDLFLMFGELPESNIGNLDSGGAAGELTVESPLPSMWVQLTANRAESAVLKFVESKGSPQRIEKTSLAIPEFISWTETTAISESVLSYLRNAPPRGIGQSKRLEYFIEFLEDKDPLIAIDTWAEFGCSSYEEVVAVRSLMSREKLRSWIADPLMSPERLGLYGMMLGLCGHAEDAEFLQKHMQDHSQPGGSLRFGSEGLMGGYLLLTGESGLRSLEETFVFPDNVPDTASHALVQALQFMWSCERDIIPESRIREGMRLFLKNETMREIAITNLSRWEDWDSLPELIAMFGNQCADDRSAQQAIIRFAQACVKAGQLKESPGVQTADAVQFLDRIRESRPELIASPLKDFTAPQ